MKSLSVLFLALASVVFAQSPVATPTSGSPFRGPERVSTATQALVVAGARAVPSPTSVVVTVTVNGGTAHTFTYSLQEAEATKNRLVLQSKVTPTYTPDSFALALLADLEKQANTDLASDPTTTSAEAAKLQAARAAAQAAVAAVDIATDAAAAKGTIK